MQQTVGYRFVWWSHDVAPELTDAESARAHEAFAAEFEALPACEEPYAGWGLTMAELCRRIARLRKGIHV